MKRWIQRHWAIGTLLLLFVGVVPIGMGLWASHRPTGVQRVILEALVGGWPDENSATERWIQGIGVGLSALAVFGIPTILGVAITILLEKIKRVHQMLLHDYITNRDEYIGNEIWAHFRNIVKEGITEEQCYRIVQDAIASASKHWQVTLDPKISRGDEFRRASDCKNL